MDKIINDIDNHINDIITNDYVPLTFVDRVYLQPHELKRKIQQWSKIDLNEEVLNRIKEILVEYHYITTGNNERIICNVPNDPFLTRIEINSELYFILVNPTTNTFQPVRPLIYHLSFDRYLLCNIDRYHYSNYIRRMDKYLVKMNMNHFIICKDLEEIFSKPFDISYFITIYRIHNLVVRDLIPLMYEYDWDVHTIIGFAVYTFYGGLPMTSSYTVNTKWLSYLIYVLNEYIHEVYRKHKFCTLSDKENLISADLYAFRRWTLENFRRSEVEIISLISTFMHNRQGSPLIRIRGLTTQIPTTDSEEKYDKDDELCEEKMDIIGKEDKENKKKKFNGFIFINAVEYPDIIENDELITYLHECNREILDSIYFTTQLFYILTSRYDPYIIPLNYNPFISITLIERAIFDIIMDNPPTSEREPITIVCNYLLKDKENDHKGIGMNWPDRLSNDIFIRLLTEYYKHNWIGEKRYDIAENCGISHILCVNSYKLIQFKRNYVNMQLLATIALDIYWQVNKEWKFRRIGNDPITCYKSMCRKKNRKILAPLRHNFNQLEYFQYLNELHLYGNKLMITLAMNSEISWMARSLTCTSLIKACNYISPANEYIEPIQYYATNTLLALLSSRSVFNDVFRRYLVDFSRPLGITQTTIYGDIYKIIYPIKSNKICELLQFIYDQMPRVTDVPWNDSLHLNLQPKSFMWSRYRRRTWNRPNNINYICPSNNRITNDIYDCPIYSQYRRPGIIQSIGQAAQQPNHLLSLSHDITTEDVNKLKRSTNKKVKGICQRQPFLDIGVVLVQRQEDIQLPQQLNDLVKESKEDEEKADIEVTNTSKESIDNSKSFDNDNNKNDNSGSFKRSFQSDNNNNNDNGIDMESKYDNDDEELSSDLEYYHMILRDELLEAYKSLEFRLSQVNNWRQSQEIQSKKVMEVSRASCEDISDEVLKEEIYPYHFAYNRWYEFSQLVRRKLPTPFRYKYGWRNDKWDEVLENIFVTFDYIRTNTPHDISSPYRLCEYLLNIIDIKIIFLF